jgi:NADPH:quinone reductase-like Zn-dependent oxidoreductase
VRIEIGGFHEGCSGVGVRHAPRYQDFPDPEPTNEHEIVVDVVACGLHPRVRSQADGSHYTSTGALPLVPGIDGVGRDADGNLRFFILIDTARGAMAQRTVIDERRSFVLPAGADPVAQAAGINPAMSSWVALRRRIDFPAGADVLVLGATGNAGRMAVQVAKRLGARRVLAAGRTADILAELPELAREITAGTFDVNARTIPLADVTKAWATAAGGPERIVLVP